VGQAAAQAARGNREIAAAGGGGAVDRRDWATVNPSWVQSYAQGSGLLAKADRIDSKLLALYAQFRSGGRSHGASPAHQVLRVTRRSSPVRITDIVSMVDCADAARCATRRECYVTHQESSTEQVIVIRLVF
jgi:hypothetical protein